MGCGNSLDVKPASRFIPQRSIKNNVLLETTEANPKDPKTFHYNPSQLKPILVKKAPKPLINLGNSCYINSRNFSDPKI
jgi:hypothetical protein